MQRNLGPSASRRVSLVTRALGCQLSTFSLIYDALVDHQGLIACSGRSVAGIAKTPGENLPTAKSSFDCCVVIGHVVSLKRLHVTADDHDFRAEAVLPVLKCFSY